MGEAILNCCFSDASKLAERRHLLFALAWSAIAHFLVVIAAPLDGGARETRAYRATPTLLVRLINASPGNNFEFPANVTIGPAKPAEFSPNMSIASPEPREAVGALHEERSKGKELLPGRPPDFHEVEYFPSERLSVRPYPLTVLESAGVAEFGQNGLQGRLVLSVWVSAEGVVVAAETEYTDMPESIHEASVAAFLRMRFSPGKIDGVPVGSVMKIEITYEDFRLPQE